MVVVVDVVVDVNGDGDVVGVVGVIDHDADHVAVADQSTTTSTSTSTSTRRGEEAQPGRTVSLRQEGVLRRPMTLYTRCSSDLFLKRMGGMATAATRSAIFR